MAKAAPPSGNGEKLWHLLPRPEFVQIAVIPEFPKYRQAFIWHKADSLPHNRPPMPLRSWLLDDGSLTRRLQHICDNEFRVRVLAQGWAVPLINEAQRLHIAFKYRVFTREVLLYCGDHAMVFARTVIPRRTLKGHLSRLANLGNKPLGEVLFAHPHIKRDYLEVARLRSGHYLYNHSLQAANAGCEPTTAATIWARRSTFAYHNKRLLVSEIFLPNREFGYCVETSEQVRASS